MRRRDAHARDGDVSRSSATRRSEPACSEAIRDVIKKARPSFEAWRFSLFQSQSGQGWDLAISGPRFRKVFTLYGPADDLPGLVSAYVEAIVPSR